MLASRYDVVISGMGPAGLAVAYEALQAGKSVLIISNRTDDFVRVQSLFLTNPMRDYLTSMLRTNAPISDADNQFLELLTKSLGIAIKDIERFIKRRIDEYVPDTQLSCVFESQLCAIDFNNGKATIESLDKSSPEQTINFTYLIGADGNQHHAANVLNRDENNPHIKYITSEEPDSIIISPGNRQNVFFYAEMRRSDGQAFKLPTRQFLVLPGENLESKREAFAYYVFYIMFDKNYKKIDEGQKSIKFSLGAELPMRLHNHLKTLSNLEEQKRTVIDYITPYFFERLKKEGVDSNLLEINIVKPSKKHGANKDKMKFSLFNTNLSGADTVAFEMNGHYFALIGDAVRKPFFHISHGLNDALFESSLLAKVFKGEMKIEEYNTQCLNRSKEVSRYTRELGECYTDFDRRWEQAAEVEAKVLSKFNSQEPKPAPRR